MTAKQVCKNYLSFFALFVGLFLILFSIFFIDSAWALKANPETGTVSETVSILNQSSSATGRAIQSVSSETVFDAIQTKFSYNGFGLKFKFNNKSADQALELFVKTDSSDWFKTYVMEDTGMSDHDGYLYTDPIFLSGQSIQIKGDVNNISDLELIYFNSTASPSTKILRKITADNETGVKIISRAEWGADESYRFWSPQYTEPKAFVIHHTAGGDGGEDPSATVRGIYYWHAVVLGWGDIGYNYLIDHEGNIYEGRYGGDKVIGAHTYNSTEGINYNEGTIGVSVLGCFEDEKEGCYTTSEYNINIEKAVTDLIAEKATDLKMSLTSSATLFSKNINRVVGHRDLDYTLCPGSIIENELTNIRTLSSSKKDIIDDTRIWQAELVEQTFSNKYMVDTSESINITYNNNGDYAWPKEKVFLKVRNKKTKQTIKIYPEHDVAVGDSYTFNYNWQADKVGKQNILLRLFRKSYLIEGSRAEISVKVNNPNKAKLVDQNFPIAVLENWNPLITVNYLNNGTTTWSHEDTVLAVNGKWVGLLEQVRVAPGETGTFSFLLQDINDLQIGQNNLVVKIVQGRRTVYKSRFTRIFRVD
ncbi:MAG: N-acetylmuramoyl-L-alanine amidase [Patescibacteria group bacterium]